MAGGLMSLVSQGQGNIILNGNPQKSFFKSRYAQYTNFGLQKFRLDFEGSKSLKLNEESTFDFKILRYADLLMDTYISVNLPNIWSPVLPPQDENINSSWIPYEFKWIENIGTKMISKITINCGNQQLAQYSGDYLLSLVQRDWLGQKKALYNSMSGNIPQFVDPSNYGSNGGNYPNAYFTPDTTGPQPSILGRTIYIPMNVWFTLNSLLAFPLVSLQYNELHIYVTFRPINQLFVIRDIYNPNNNYPYVAPNFNLPLMQMYRFLQPPPDTSLTFNSYIDKRDIWNADIHLNCTYAFLSNDEQRLFATQQQEYLITQVQETIFYNNFGTNKIDLQSLGMVKNWMFYFQRSDANLRNEWSNYTNFPYNSSTPCYICPAPFNGSEPFFFSNSLTTSNIGPGINLDGTLTNLYTTSLYNTGNVESILIDLGILLDGSYRENIQPAGIYNYIEKYVRTNSFAPPGLYCYNFCLNTDVKLVNPSGAMNLSRFNNIEFEFTTITPPLNLLAQSLSICDSNTGEIIGINKSNWQIYQYTFDLHVFEERVNIVTFISGNAALLWAT
jgi:hypothetical protein